VRGTHGHTAPPPASGSAGHGDSGRVDRRVPEAGRAIRRGGSAEAWCARYAPAFRRQFGWMPANP